MNLMEEYVLRGNSAILKCHIPSFVSEYVTVISWIISEDDNELDIKIDSSNNFDGMMLIVFEAMTAFTHPDHCHINIFLWENITFT